jgi:hypothetical protein
MRSWHDVTRRRVPWCLKCKIRNTEIDPMIEPYFSFDMRSWHDVTRRRVPWYFKCEVRNTEVDPYFSWHVKLTWHDSPSRTFGFSVQSYNTTQRSDWRLTTDPVISGVGGWPLPGMHDALPRAFGFNVQSYNTTQRADNNLTDWLTDDWRLWFRFGGWPLPGMRQ